MTDSFKARSALKVGDRSYEIWRLDALPKSNVGKILRKDLRGLP